MGEQLRGVLNRQEIDTLLQNKKLLLNPRRGKDGQFDIENDSYDLAAGTAIWKEKHGSKWVVKTLHYSRRPSIIPQPTLTVQPGQMIFVVTHEDVLMPQNLCGTVYSRNKLALEGILALNAGHVDSGYEGPIVIRLINLRAITWTLTLGDPIFTITFQTTNPNSDESLKKVRRVSQKEMVLRVRETANAALSNALYDLYSDNVDQRLNEFKTDALIEFRNLRDERWVQRDKLWSALFDTWWKKFLAIIIPFILLVAAVIGGVVGVGTILGILQRWVLRIL